MFKFKKVDAFILMVVFSIFHIQIFSQEIQIDHVISVVSDIDKAINYYSEKGFTIKKGRLHKNGLINGHIKFKNKTSFELMSIKGEATDKMSKDYEELLNNGEGGVYVAISGINTGVMEMKLTYLKISYNTIKGQNWNYITFPKSSSLAHFFFIESNIVVNDSIDILTHKNKSEKIQAIWIEGDDYVEYFLKGIGLKSAGIISDIDLGDGERFLTCTGDIIIIPRKSLNERPRIKSVSFEKDDNIESVKIKF